MIKETISLIGIPFVKNFVQYCANVFLHMYMSDVG